ncbi:MAG: EscN/YscN/HrcN family type III secretion system ATPase, partial [Oxalobacteraceae bacterium]|nr:EscN/YscN/HrcN family type III secretion system ATPase [Oxalobacteraceae bacterium]
LLIRLGEYKPGGDPVADVAVRLRPEQLKFLRQDTRHLTPFDQMLRQLDVLAE